LDICYARRNVDKESGPDPGLFEAEKIGGNHGGQDQGGLVGYSALCADGSQRRRSLWTDQVRFGLGYRGRSVDPNGGGVQQLAVYHGAEQLSFPLAGATYVGHESGQVGGFFN